MRIPPSDGEGWPTSCSALVTVRAAMSVHQQRFGFGDRLLSLHHSGLLHGLRRCTWLNVVVFPTPEQRGHRSEGTGAGSEGERLGEAATQGSGNEVGEERAAGQVVRGRRREMGERGRSNQGLHGVVAQEGSEKASYGGKVGHP